MFLRSCGSSIRMPPKKFSYLTSNHTYYFANSNKSASEHRARPHPSERWQAERCAVRHPCDRAWCYTNSSPAALADSFYSFGSRCRRSRTQIWSLTSKYACGAAADSSEISRCCATSFPVLHDIDWPRAIRPEFLNFVFPNKPRKKKSAARYWEKKRTDSQANTVEQQFPKLKRITFSI